MVKQASPTNCVATLALCVFLVLLSPFILAMAPPSFSRAPATAVVAQDPKTPKGVWDGVFTEAQAERGNAVFQAHCATCHDASELGEAPLLAADPFMRAWEGHTVGRLYTKILEMMPPNNVQSVSPAQKLDVLTYILRENGFPSGAEELKADADALARIQIVPKGGPAPLRTGAMVQVVGCLTQGPANGWLLTKSTEPAATTLDPQTLAELKAVESQSLGAQTVQLLSVFPSPEALNGHRIHAKGLLVRKGPDVAVNVVMLRSITPACQ